MKKFKEMAFHYCFNCGYGECGVHDYFLTFDEAYDIIVRRSCREDADRWVESEDTHFDFGYGDYYMVADFIFDEEHWEGSDDY